MALSYCFYLAYHGRATNCAMARLKFKQRPLEADRLKPRD
jgi:hypothetical protein